jgi:hypothetical protein
MTKVGTATQPSIEGSDLRKKYREHLQRAKEITERHAITARKIGGRNIRKAARVLAELAAADAELGREVQILEELAPKVFPFFSLPPLGNPRRRRSVARRDQ